jgi:hypothetical protein
MTLREIDDALASWSDRLSAAARNLMDLQAEPTFQFLSGTGGMPKARLEGASAAQVEPALGAMTTAFQHFGVLNETIDRAASIRRNLPRFGADQKLREIEQLLRGKSIHLSKVDIPIEQRSLLSGVEHEGWIAPNDLLEVMVHAFEAARDAVIAVDAASKRVAPALNRLGTRIRSLAARIESPGSPWSADLEAADRALAKMRAQVQLDPLAASDALEHQVQPVLDRIETALNTRDALRGQLNGGFAAAGRTLETLVQAHQEALAACAEARLKVAGCGYLPAAMPQAEIDELRAWLARLQTKYEQGMIDPVAVGLRNWNSRAAKCVVTEGATRDANRAPVEARNELRGRLDALKAKARAYGIAEDDRLAELARQAEALLYTRPVSLDRAAAAVVAYEKMLNGAK